MWEQLLLSADFVGIVECEVAGGIVAKYRVIDSWKGQPQKGDIISIRTAVNYWEPQFPMSLCGERSIVTAYKEQPQSRIMSTTPGGGVPLWWRSIPAEYKLPLFEGEIWLSDKTKDFFDSPHHNLDSFKEAAMELFEMDPEEREKLLLRILCDKYLFHLKGHWDKSFKTSQTDPDLALLKIKIEKAKSVEDIIGILLAIPRQEGPGGYRIDSILQQGGGKITLEILEKRMAENSALNLREQKYTLDAIRERLKLSTRRGEERPTEAQQPSEEKLSELRLTLDKGASESNYRFSEAFSKLTVYDPEYVLDYLLAWQRPDNKWQTTDQGYVMGSYFAWKCGEDRKKHLQALTEAKDDYIRVAAATYLTFEDDELGRGYLRKLMGLEGDPGVWAALNLVRRGEKAAMPRALEVFNTVKEGGMDGAFHRNLQKRLKVLLSNSCRVTGIPMPDIKLGSVFEAGRWRNLSPQEAQEKNLMWWSEHKDALIISDPWLAELAKQKVD